MTKQKIIRGLCIVVLCTGFGGDVLAEPFEFPMIMGSDQWKSSSNEERIDSCQVPEDILKDMSTEDLVKTCLNFPIRHQFVLGNTYPQGVDGMVRIGNCFRELLRRSDGSKYLIQEYWEMDPSLDRSGLPDKVQAYELIGLSFVEVLIARPEMLLSLSSDEKRAFLEKLSQEGGSRAQSMLFSGDSYYFLVGRVLISSGIIDISDLKKLATRHGESGLLQDPRFVRFLRTGNNYSNDIGTLLKSIVNDWANGNDLEVDHAGQ